MGNLIKVHLTYDDSAGGPGGEFLWAARINATTAKLDNIPFFTKDFTLGDLVEIDARNEIVGVIERVARTRHGRYKKAKRKREQITQWDMVRQHFQRDDIHTEPAFLAFSRSPFPTIFPTSNWL